MMKKFLTVSLLSCTALCAFSSAAGAQTGAQMPVLPRGVSLAKVDTIYKLAVKAVDHPTKKSITLLEDRIITIEADGRERNIRHYVGQVLTQDGAEDWGERSFHYDADRERLTIHWMKVIDPNGKLISDKPAQEQETGSKSSDTLSYSSRTKRVSLAGVVPGSIVDICYTTEIFKPALPGVVDHGFSYSYFDIKRVRHVLDVPKSLELKIKERNLPRPRITRDYGARRVHTWTLADLTKEEDSEPFASDSNDTSYPNVSIVSVHTAQEIGTLYDSLAKDRYKMTPELKTKVSAIVASARTLDDSIRAVHRWIAQDIRYEGRLLGLGRHAPREPAAVLESRYGDSKDKTTLFVTIMRDWGLQASPVLQGGSDRSMITPYSFYDVIAAVDYNGKMVYTDLTDELLPFGEQFGYRNSAGLRIALDGTVEEVKIPRSAMDSNVTAFVLEGTLLPDGTLNARFTTSAAGMLQRTLRSNFSRPLDKDDLDELGRTLAASIYDGGKKDSLWVFAGKDLSAKPEIVITVRGAKAARAVGDSYILPLQVGALYNAQYIKSIEPKKPRVSWINAESIFGYNTVKHVMKLTLPNGWLATLPKSVTANSPFGSYESKYEQNGTQLIVSRTVKGSDAVLPPASMPDLLAWMRIIAADDPKFIVLKPSGS